MSLNRDEKRGLGFLGVAFVWLAFIIVLSIGWGMNAYKIVKQCDFESPYRCEVIRTIGFFVPPAGGIIGYMDIEE